LAKYEARAEVTGAVWKITAKQGQKLAPGETIMIIESMKMEIPVVAEDGGIVGEILVAKGTPVTEGQVVAILEA